MSIRIEFFDTWQAGFANASVAVYVAGTQTLASLFKDEALTQPAGNPQTLASMFRNDVGYGKFAAPLYTSQAYYIVVNSVDQTGVIRPPLTTLTGQDASDATVAATGGSTTRKLKDIVAAVIDARNFGAIGPAESAATNNATLTTVVSAAAALGGAEVLLPEGAIVFTAISLSTGVLLRGRGREVTTLQSQTAGRVITINGDRAGLAHLTLDGINLQVGSIGVYSKAQDELRLIEVLVKRFETGIQLKGGRRVDWQNLYVDNCKTGADLRGDTDAGSGGGGDDFRHNRWYGGRVTTCTDLGVQLNYVDSRVFHNTIEDVGFENNPGTALKIVGARFSNFPGSWFKGNTNNFNITDGTDPTKSDQNTVVGVKFGPGGLFSGGAGTFNGRCQDVIFEQCELADNASLVFTLATNVVLALDCFEDSSVSIGGSDSARWMRQESIQGNSPFSFGVTSDATPTAAFRYVPDPGTSGVIVATVAAQQRNGTQVGLYKIARPFKRPGSTLNYQNEISNFTVGDIITGATSGAKARVIADADAGATGTLTLKDITKEFVNGETITGTLSGNAQANGVLSHQNSVLLGATTRIIADQEDDVNWNADFGVSGYEVQVLVTGAAAKTIEWQTSTAVTGG